MKLTFATIVRGCGPDKASLNTELPSPTPALGKENLSLKFDAAYGTAIDYLRQHFPSVKKIRLVDVNDGSSMILNTNGKWTYEVSPRKIGRTPKFSKP